MKKLSDVSLSLILCLLPACSNHSMAGLHAPYPPSKTITKLTWAPEVVKMKGCDTAALGIFEAPKPWGPWSTVYYDDPSNAGFKTRRWRGQRSIMTTPAMLGLKPAVGGGP